MGAETRALHLEALLERNPNHLSAGEAQLVQLARALVRRPALLLLDEPLARLDASVSQRMRLELRALQEGYGVTTFVTTNDPIEAMALPDRLVVLDGGRVVQIGSPIEVYERPVSLVAAACTGVVSLLSVAVEADADGFWLVHPSFRHRAWRPSLADYVGAGVVMALRPTWMRLRPEGAVRAEVTMVNLVTGMLTVVLEGGAHRDSVELGRATPAHRSGDQIAFDIDQMALFDPSTGTRLP